MGFGFKKISGGLGGALIGGGVGGVLGGGPGGLIGSLIGGIGGSGGLDGKPGQAALPPDPFVEERNRLLSDISGASKDFINPGARKELIGKVNKLTVPAAEAGDRLASLTSLREQFDGIVGKGRDSAKRFKSLIANIQDRPGLAATQGGGSLIG
jgi:hypothetical protein